MTTYKHVEIEISQDTDAENPYTDVDMLGHANAYSRHLIRPDENKTAQRIANYYGVVDLAELKRTLKQEGAVILVDFMGDGYAWITRDEIIAEYGAYNPATSRKARRRLEGQVETFRQWSEGEVYGYMIHALDADGNRTGEQLDSCWGYYGYESCEEEADSAAQSYEADADAEQAQVICRLDMVTA